MLNRTFQIINNYQITLNMIRHLHQVLLTMFRCMLLAKLMQVYHHAEMV